MLLVWTVPHATRSWPRLVDQFRSIKCRESSLLLHSTVTHWFVLISGRYVIVRCATAG